MTVRRTDSLETAVRYRMQWLLPADGRRKAATAYVLIELTELIFYILLDTKYSVVQ